MKRFVTLMTLAILIVSCGNPHISEEPANDNVTGTTPVEPDPQDPNWPPQDPQQPPQKVLVEVNAQAVTADEAKQMNLVYKKIVKTIELGNTVKSKSCPDGHDHHCVKDRQVVFQFDLTNVDLPDNKYKLEDAEILGDYYSIGKNYRTELLCLLNSNVCSGKGILKFPKIGLSFLVKMLWWNSAFWVNDYNQMVPTTLFQDTLDSGWNPNENIFIRENQLFSLKDLYNWPSENLQHLLDRHKKWNFVISDDTFVDRPLLRLRFQRVR